MNIFESILTQLATHYEGRKNPESDVVHEVFSFTIFNHYVGNEWLPPTTKALEKYGEKYEGSLYIPYPGKPEGIPGTLTGYSQLESGLIVPDWLAQGFSLPHQKYDKPVMIVPSEDMNFFKKSMHSRK